MAAIYTQTNRKTKFLQIYQRYRIKADQYTNRMHLLKIVLLMVGIIFFGFLYIIYVNKASTSGYFHKIESNKLENYKFDYNLVKLEVMEAKKQLRNLTDLRMTHNDPVQILTDVVTISHANALSLK